MIIQIEDKELIKKTMCSSIKIDIMSIDFFGKTALFKVWFINDIFSDEDTVIRYIQIIGDEYDEWGNDDQYIINLILNKLNLIKKNNI